MNNAVQDVLDPILDRQKEAWLAGQRPTIEELLHDSSLRPDADVILDLVYNEIVVREEIGESPSLDGYLRQFPDLKDDLKLHFEVHRVIHDQNGLADTQRLQGEATLPDLEELPSEMLPTLAGYEILGELGRGGMGVVYKARHCRLKRVVAVKMFHPGRTPSQRELNRFRAEAEAIARLQHPNIVQIFEIGEDKGLPFISLELAEQGTLAQQLLLLPLPPVAAAELTETLARALQHAHDHHIVHRDLKPANVLLTKAGVPKITDFGLAKILDEDFEGDATRSGETIGTPRYMAPEQATGRPDQVGPWTDVYALGTLLYECLTGQVPFVASSAVETLDRICHEEPVSPRRLQRSVPRDLETICLKCLHKRPGRRYATALALAEDLRKFVDGEPIRARPTPTWERAWMWSRRHPRAATAIAMSIPLVLAGLIAYGFHRHHEEQRLNTLRQEAIQLVLEGRAFLAEHEVPKAKDKFVMALGKVQVEPELRDLELGIRGWLDHALSEDKQQLWKKRQPPPLLDELRDEALLLSVVFDPRKPEPLAASREAVRHALTFAVAGVPSLRLDRELLTLVRVDLILRRGEAAEALEALDQMKSASSRLWHLRRADCLERLDRQPEADEERLRAKQLVPKKTFEFLLSGIENCYRHDLDRALGDFDRVLTVEPEHFTARLLQAACFLRLNRPGEAKVGLTACRAQSPRFVWSFLLRSEACLQLGDMVAAASDLQQASEVKLREAPRHYLEQSIDALGLALEKLPANEREAFWSAKIATESGLQALRDVATFRKLLPLGQE